MKTISIRLSDHEHRKLIQQAEKLGTTITDLIRDAAKKAADNSEDEIKKMVLDSESRTAERICDFRKNLVAEFSSQQQQMKKKAGEYNG
ncbi:HK97 gp10 family phage protein [Maridesulfovibrio frigidus]|uniref:HK97 gp10 family phage protein n=1 Tax=Maridesulfovibrio frigidus TaxID=340956 RepID=UPI0004E1547B|nr:HK97 gp10 family phage protein [Maridesulfovibrio frigidus]